MGYGQRGRPRAEGDRYPSGKLKPASIEPAAAQDGARTPISGALWQRMLADAEKVFGDARFGTELTRLGAIGSLTPSEVATGIRIAGIYGRFEYYKNLRRSAPSPHYIREYISEGAGSDTEAVNFRAKEGRERDRTFNPEDRETREAEAVAAFKSLQTALPTEYRAELEMLCVEDRHVGYQGLQRARIGLAIVKDLFEEQRTGTGRKDRKAARKKRRPISLPTATPAATSTASTINPLKAAFITLHRATSPHLTDQGLEEAWSLFCALKSREEFRADKAKAR